MYVISINMYNTLLRSYKTKSRKLMNAHVRARTVSNGRFLCENIEDAVSKKIWEGMKFVSACAYACDAMSGADASKNKIKTPLKKKRFWIVRLLKM